MKQQSTLQNIAEDKRKNILASSQQVKSKEQQSSSTPAPATMTQVNDEPAVEHHGGQEDTNENKESSAAEVSVTPVEPAGHTQEAQAVVSELTDAVTAAPSAAV